MAGAISLLLQHISFVLVAIAGIGFLAYLFTFVGGMLAADARRHLARQVAVAPVQPRRALPPQASGMDAGDMVAAPATPEPLVASRVA